MSTTRPADLALIAGASLRLSRFVTTDTLGGWLTAPAVRWAARHEVRARQDGRENTAPVHPDDPVTWQARAVAGLGCPFCVGTWLGFGVIATHLLARRSAPALAAWRAVAGGLSLNYLAGHLSSRIDH